MEWNRKFDEANQGTILSVHDTSHVFIQNDFNVCMYTEWDVKVCPIAAAIHSGLYNLPIEKGDVVNVIGASVYALMHISELVGLSGEVHASVDFDTEALNLLRLRYTNIYIHINETREGFMGHARPITSLIAIPSKSENIIEFLKQRILYRVPLMSPCKFMFVLSANCNFGLFVQTLGAVRLVEQLKINNALTAVIANSRHGQISRPESRASDDPLSSSLLDYSESLQLGIVHMNPQAEMIGADMELIDAATLVIAAYEEGSISGPMSHRLCSLAIGQIGTPPLASEVPSLHELQLMFDLQQQVHKDSL